MKKLIVLVAVIAMVLSMAGCMVATNEVMALPGFDAGNNEYALYTYYGETVAPIQTVGLPAGKDVNVIEIALDGAKLYVDEMTEEEKSSITSGALNDMDYAYQAIRAALGAEIADMDETDEAEAEEQADGQSAADDAVQVMQDLDQLMTFGKETADMLTSISGLGVATYRASDAQERIDAFYPGYVIDKAYTLVISDMNGLYPLDGPKQIEVRIKESDAEYPAKIALISPNGAVSTRIIRQGNGEINFTVPSTPGTLVLLLGQAAAE